MLGDPIKGHQAVTHGSTDQSCSWARSIVFMSDRVLTCIKKQFTSDVLTLKHHVVTLLKPGHMGFDLGKIAFKGTNRPFFFGGRLMQIVCYLLRIRSIGRTLL